MLDRSKNLPNASGLSIWIMLYILFLRLLHSVIACGTASSSVQASRYAKSQSSLLLIVVVGVQACCPHMLYIDQSVYLSKWLQLWLSRIHAQGLYVAILPCQNQNYPNNCCWHAWKFLQAVRSAIAEVGKLGDASTSFCCLFQHSNSHLCSNIILCYTCDGNNWLIKYYVGNNVSKPIYRQFEV